VASALQIWSQVFCRHFDVLPPKVQTDVLAKIDDLGRRLDTFPHARLVGRSEFKLRVGGLARALRVRCERRPPLPALRR
jgi:hypothetical protein